MSQVFSQEGVRAALASLMGLVDETAVREREVTDAFAGEMDAGQREFETARASLERELRESSSAGRKALEASLRELNARYEKERASTERAWKTEETSIRERAEVNEKAARQALAESIWLAEAVFEAEEHQPREQYEARVKTITAADEARATLLGDASALLKRYRQGAAVDELNLALNRAASRGAGEGTVVAGAVGDEEVDALERAMVDARGAVESIRRMPLPRLLQGGVPAVLVGVLAALGAGAGWWLGGGTGLHAALGAAGGLVLAGLVLGITVPLARSMARTRAAHAGERLGIAQAEAATAREHAAKVRAAREAALAEKRDAEIKAAREKHMPVVAHIAERRAHHLERVATEYPERLQTLHVEHERAVTEARLKHAAAQDAQRAAHDAALRAASAAWDARRARAEQRNREDWQALRDRWMRETNRRMAEIEEAVKAAQLTFPEWSDRAWPSWRPVEQFAPAVRVGWCGVDLSAREHGLPRHDDLKLPGPAKFEVPALLTYPSGLSMMLETATEGHDAAVAALQMIMFRILTGAPAGKVRFTIIDPIGLGQNFAGFMHLADHDGASVGDRIWTEERHIEQRLVDLTEHMENVIQKYLRNEYPTIADYNAQAGEIAEPLRFLVIANFPANFSEGASRRLQSIIASGARCGVHTLMSVDTRAPMPSGVHLSDLRKAPMQLEYKDGRFSWRDEVMGQTALRLDEPADEALLTRALRLIGEGAKIARRVEVPFAAIAPSEAQQWTGDTRGGVRVALGRTGATKLQYLSLGEGTRQHALVAGKTGSGKSTLLHALITNLALWMSPDEIELYLIDFKKGVEFATYATNELPHAKVVAIESDREFGLSVLQKLDAELRDRGTMFRELGVQDVAGYRRAKPEARLPRILLVVDEFQELFTEDDKLAQDCSLLLDRLVRQGRAFGMHVLLGSQTLGGAYTLARSTMGQMGVRIALQCSEADSYLILSEDNAAARLLSRPGEAIYNDSSGMVEGNSPFQIVWLGEEERDRRLADVRKLAQKRGWKRSEPTIVFEGSAPADLERNHLLNAAIHDRASEARNPGGVARAWLGEPVAIKDPTSVTFGRHSGSHLLIVGQRDDAALGMTCATMISLAAQHAQAIDGAQLYVLDGLPADAPNAGFIDTVGSALGPVCRVGGYREVEPTIAEIHAELLKRQETGEGVGRAVYLIIHGLQRFRAIRQEEDFGFSSAGESGASKPDKQFGAILKEGAALGIHVIAWVDTLNNLNRSLDRAGLREFENRVLFQMSASDSSHLIDSPAASKLGLHHAILHREETGTAEKFRPYAPVSAVMLKALAERMRGPLPAV